MDHKRVSVLQLLAVEVLYSELMSLFDFCITHNNPFEPLYSGNQYHGWAILRNLVGALHNSTDARACFEDFTDDYKAIN